MVTTSIPPRPALVPGARIGRYELLHELEHDAIASTWISRERGAAASPRAARLSILEHRVSAELELKTRFLREARAAIRIKHPGFAQVLDSGPAGPGDTHLATVYFDAASLRELLTAVAARGVELSEGAILRIALDLAEPLSEMHALRLEGPGALPLFHGDLRPEAIFVTLEGTTRVVPSCLSSAVCMLSDSAAVERLAYKAPEQLEHAGQGHGADAHADQFALGVVLYEAFTGTRPFSAADPLELVRTLLEARAPSLGTLRPDLPPAVVAIADRLLKRDPHARFRSLEEARSALEAAAQGVMADRAQVALAVRELAGDRITQRREAVRARSLELSKAAQDAPSSPMAARSITPRPAMASDAAPRRSGPSALPPLRPPPLPPPSPKAPQVAQDEEPSTQRVPSVVPKKSLTPAQALSPRLSSSEPPRKVSTPELRSPVGDSAVPRTLASNAPRPAGGSHRPSLRDLPPRPPSSEVPRPAATAVAPRPAVSDASRPAASDAPRPAVTEPESDAPVSSPPSSSSPESSERAPVSRPADDQPPSSKRAVPDSAREGFEPPSSSEDPLVLRAEDIVDSRASGSEFEPVPSEALQTVEERDPRRISTMPPAARKPEPKAAREGKTARDATAARDAKSPRDATAARRSEAKPVPATAQPAAARPASRNPLVAALVGVGLGVIASVVYILVRTPAPEVSGEAAPVNAPVETAAAPIETAAPPAETAAAPIETAAPTAAPKPEPVAPPAETAAAPKPAARAPEPRAAPVEPRPAPAEPRPAPAAKSKPAAEPAPKPAAAPKEKPAPKPASKGKDDRMLDGI